MKIEKNFPKMKLKLSVNVEGDQEPIGIFPARNFLAKFVAQPFPRAAYPAPKTPKMLVAANTFHTLLL